MCTKKYEKYKFRLYKDRDFKYINNFKESGIICMVTIGVYTKNEGFSFKITFAM